MSKPFRGVINIDIKQSAPTGARTRSPWRYPGQRPWAFTGGSVKRVVIDVSGQAFVDLAREAAAAFARQ